MREPTKPTGDPNGAEPEHVLRAKYHDYCSARVADTLLALTPDEIFVLAEEAARAIGGSDELTYDRAVRLATSRVSRTLALPSFDQWVIEYRADPERIEQELIGLWKTEPDPADPE